MNKRLISRICNKMVWIRGCLGTMESYYKISEWCEKKEREIQDDDKRKKKYRRIILIYSKLVSGKPFHTVKESENEEIWEAINSGKLEKDYAKEISYIKRKNQLMLYPYEFMENYSVSEKQVFSCNDCNLCYVFHNGKKLYFPKEEHTAIADKYLQLIAEQDKNSPHRYFQDSIPKCDVFVDVGSAEGIISLDAVENVGEIYLLECSRQWIKALEATFSAYKDKVHIIRKFAGSYDDENTITLDSLLSKYRNKKIVIKMDIEGMELDALKGSKKIMIENDCLFSCTTYHTNSAFEELKEFFENNDYLCKSTTNYMLFIYGYMTLCNGKYQRMKYPYFRHGLIRAEKKMDS